MIPANTFKTRVYILTKQIPKGKVVSYGQVATALGQPRAARQVGWALNQSKEVDNIPWWRVINNKGYISIKGSEYSAQFQRDLLREEGVQVSEKFEIDIENYRYHYLPQTGLC